MNLTTFEHPPKALSLKNFEFECLYDLQLKFCQHEKKNLKIKFKNFNYQIMNFCGKASCFYYLVVMGQAKS